MTTPADDHDESRWTTVALIVLIACAAIAIAAAQVGRFGPWCAWPLVASLPTTFIAAIDELRRRASRVAVPLRGSRFIVPLAIAAPLGLALVRYVHPCESILGLDDQGTYSAVAVNLARTGAVGIAAPLWDDAPAEDREALVTRRPLMAMAHDADAPREPLYAPAFFVAQRGDRGELLSTFPAGFPVLVACGLATGGWALAGRTNDALILVGDALLAVLAARWFGALIGVTTWAVAVLQPLGLWMAASLYAEPSVAVAWLAGFALITTPRLSSGACVAAAVAWAGSITLKIDGLAALAAAPFAILTASAAPRRVRLAGLIAWVIAAGVALDIACGAHGAYLLGSLRSMQRTLTEQRFGLAAAGAAGVALTVGASTARGRAVGRWACAVATVALAIFGWFVRPSLEPDHPFFFWPKAMTVSSYRSLTLQRLGWYLHPVGAWLGVLGIAGLVATTRRRDRAIWLAVGAVTIAVVCYDHLGLAHQPYIMRRFVAYGLGTLVIAMVWTACGMLAATKRFAPRSASVVAMIVAAGYAWWCARVDDQLARCDNVAGLHAQVDAAVATLPPRPVVLIERDARPPAELAPYLLARGVDVAMPSRDDDARTRARWSDLVRRWQHDGRTCVLLTDEAVQTVLIDAPAIVEQRFTIDYLQNPSLEHIRPIGPDHVVAAYRWLTLGPVGGGPRSPPR